MSTSFIVPAGQALVPGQYYWELVGDVNGVDSGYFTGLRAFSILCPADFDDGNGTGTPDGGVTIDDLLYYLAIFAVGDVSADIDDGSGTYFPDGGVTVDDLLFFLARFDAGC